MKNIVWLFLETSALALAVSASPLLWKMACLTYGWKSPCNNFMQAQMIGLGGIMKGKSALSAVDCMLETEQDCATALSRDGLRCSWCRIAPAWRQKFGKGTCMVKPVKDVGCAVMGDTTFEPIIALGIELPSVPEQAKCLIHSESQDECEGHSSGGSNCTYCILPDVYGLKPKSALCLQEEAVKVGICAMLQDVPRGARKID